MLKWIVMICIVITGSTLGIFIIPKLLGVFSISDITIINNPYVSAFLGAIIFYLLTFKAIKKVVNFIKRSEDFLINAPITDIIFGSLGLLIGLLLAFLIGFALNTIKIPIIQTLSPILLTLLFGYLGFQVGFKKRDELLSLFSIINKRQDPRKEANTGNEKNTGKILDTSVIIDGRFAEICQTGFIEGTIVIPHFVLMEVQNIADSSDALKRNRGRQGLDTLNRIQNELSLKVEILDIDFEEIQDINSKLVKLARLTNGVILTMDKKLITLCELQSVTVLNINELAHAIKPVMVPGEKMKIEVLEDGKEQNQGIAYLDDGTIVVIEDGHDYIGKRINVMITRVLQRSAGRMIFAKAK